MAEINQQLYPPRVSSSGQAEQGPTDEAADDAAWTQELDDLISRAAALAASQNLAVESFIAAAWAASLEARPGLREQLEDKELRSQIRKLRKRGLVGSA